MRRMLLRGSRIADASVIGNLDGNASFFAAQHPEHLSILVVLGASDRATSLLVNLSFVEASVAACRR